MVHFGAASEASNKTILRNCLCDAFVQQEVFAASALAGQLRQNTALQNGEHHQRC